MATPIPAPGKPPHSALAWLAALYTCRIPIINGIVLVLLPVICLVLAPTLLKNLLVMSSWNLFWCVAAADILSWSVQVTYRVTAINRGERFFLPGPTGAEPPTRKERLFTRLLPIPLIVSIFLLKGENDTIPGWLTYFLAAAGGFVLAYSLAFLSVLLAAAVAPPGQVQATDFFSIPFNWQLRWICRASRFQLFRTWRAGSRLRLLLLRLRQARKAAWPSGYFDKEGRLYGGHWIALTSFALSLLLYIGLGLAKSKNVPALSYVLQLQFFAVWALAGAAFFLDRYRIPLILPLGLVCAVNLAPGFLPGTWAAFPAWFPSSDHYYKVWKIPVRQDFPAAPGQVLGAFLGKTGGRVVVVATAGGGIQAAAWTAEVLTQLQSSIVPPAGKPGFADSIAALSGVSGGAVGMMFFGAHYDGNPNSAYSTDPKVLEQVISDAETPTLNDVAWGLTNPDVTRVLFPYLKFGSAKLDDRGSALEKAWKRSMGNVSLSKWTGGVDEGNRPVFLFNSTIAETGEPMLFATSRLNYSAQVEKTNGNFAHRKTFFAEYPGYDMEVVTAARLAASFPFVTPAARPLTVGAQYHEVDGGYYDNYGVNSLMAWLNEALDHLPAGTPKPEVLILQIRSFPADQNQAPQWKTWFYQLYAPIDGLYNARVTGQSLRGAEELRAFELALGQKARFVNACFEFHGQDAPLSWQLNRLQEQAVRDDWGSQAPATEIVRQFINGSAPTAHQACDEIAR